MQIVQSPNEILRTTARRVDFSGSRLEKIIEEMTEVLLSQKDPEGVGLAANQVGLPHNLFLARFDVKKKEVKIFINAEIIEHSEKFQPSDKDKHPPMEGCLSLPNYYGIVKRWEWVKVKFQDENGTVHTEKFEEFPATVVQHELDHISGKIFVERILEQKGRLYRITGKDKKGKDLWEEVEI